MKLDKITLATGAAALALTFLAGIAFAPVLVGSAAAQVTGPAANIEDQRGPGGPHDAFKTAADLIGISVDQLRTEMGTDKSLADVAVAHGKTRDALVKALTDAETKDIAQRIGQLVDHKGAPQGARPGGPGHPGGPGGPFGFGFAMRAEPLHAAATYLGLSQQDLMTKLRGGQTLAQIATSLNKTRDGLIQAIVDDETAKIDQAARDGKLTADIAAKLKTDLATRISDLVDGKRPAGPPGFGPRRG